MIGKSVYLLVFLVFLAVVANAYIPFRESRGTFAAKKTNKSHDLTVGFRQFGDHLVFEQNVIERSTWMGFVHVEQLSSISNHLRITQVRALDQKTDGNGAKPSLVSGGPGCSNVTLRFDSQKSHGINFIVEIYAKSNL